MLDDIALFMRVVACGGLNKTAEQLSLPPATVTRRLQRLERQMGAKLLHRSTRRFALTEDGQKLVDECGFLVDSLVERAEEIQQARQTLSGNIRVMGPVHLTTGALGDVWGSFLSAYPDVNIEFSLSNAVEDFHASRADFAIRVRPKPVEDMLSDKIGAIRTMIVASPAYLNRLGAISTPDDLRHCDFVIGSVSKHWHLYNERTGERFDYHVEQPRVFTNELALVRRQCLNGIGLTLLPLTEIHEDLAAGHLVPVLPDWQGQYRHIYIVRGRDVPPTLRAKRLMEHVKNEVQKLPVLQGQIL